MNPNIQNFMNQIQPGQPQGQGQQPQQQLNFQPPQGQAPQAPQGQFQQPPPPPWQGQPQGVPQQQFQQPPAQQAPQQAPWQAQPQQAPQPQFQPPMQGMPTQAPQQPYQQPMPGMPTQAPQLPYQQPVQQQPMQGYPQQPQYPQPPPNAFFFQGIGDVEITDNLPKLRGGFVGDVRIMRIEAKRTNTAGDRVFVEFDIVSSNSPQLHPPGQRMSWGVGIGDTEIKRNKAKQNLQKFTAAAAGINTGDTAQLNALKPQMDGMINAALAAPDQNAYIGRLVHVETNDITTKSGNAFVVHNWSPYIGG